MRGSYGTHNRGSDVRVSGALEMAVIEFDAADADVMLVVSGDALFTFTKALVGFLSPAQQAQILGSAVTP